MNIDDIYTSPEEAKKEVRKRWKDKELEKKVDEFLKHNIPLDFIKEPKAAITSHIVSPNGFLFCFYQKSKEFNLKPIVFEYLDDIFITTNFDKATLAKMIFSSGRNKSGNLVISNKHVIDLSGKNEKKKFNELKTIWGENFIDFHHRITSEIFGKNIEYFDGSNWFRGFGPKARDWYKYYLALFMRNGILFENYMMNNEREKEFMENIFFPAFNFLYKKFKIKPLIVPLTPRKDEEDIYWWSYPEFIKTLIDMKNKHLIKDIYNKIYKI